MSNADKNRHLQARLLDGSVGRSLLKMSASMIIGFFAGAAYNLTDAYFVARLGTEPLAAMGFTFPVVMIVHGLVMGIGIGAASVLSRTIGQGDPQRVRRLTMHSLYLGLALTALLIVVGYAFLRPIVTLLGADGEIASMTMAYLRIWLAGMLFTVVPMIGTNAIRATGDTLSPSLIMMADMLLNLGLDPLFIFGWGPIPAMGIEGAALATVLAHVVALFAALYILGRGKHMLTFRRPLLRGLGESWKQITYVGLPAAATNILTPIGAGIVTRIVSGYGAASVAAMTAGIRIEHCVVIPIIALGASMVPFVGQNWGAGKLDRVIAAQKIAYRWAAIWGVVCLLARADFAERIAPLLSKDNLVILQLSLYLVIMPPVMGLRGVVMASMGTLNAINRPLDATSNSIVRLFALQWPLAALGAKLAGFVGILFGILLAEFLSASIVAIWAMTLLHKARQEKEKAAPELAGVVVESEG